MPSDDTLETEMASAPNTVVTSARSAARISPRTLWRLAVALLVAGGLLGWIITLLPWAQTQLVVLEETGAHTFLVAIGEPGLALFVRALWPRGAPLSAAANALLPALIFTSAALGALLALALITRQRQRVRVALLLAYALWLAWLLAQLLFISLMIVTPLGKALVFAFTNVEPVGALTPALGLWMGWLVIALGVGGLVCARLALRRGYAQPLEAPARRSRTEVVGAGLAATGVILWCFGFFTLPWATQGCTSLQFSLNHFLRGTCQGLDSADTIVRSPIDIALQNSYRADGASLANAALAMFDPVVLALLLALLALWVLGRLWLGAQGVTRYLPLLVWLALAILISLIAAQGAEVAITHPQSLTFGAVGQWVYGPGLVVTLVGLALALLGLALAGGRATVAAAKPADAGSAL